MDNSVTHAIQSKLTVYMQIIIKNSEVALPMKVQLKKLPSKQWSRSHYQENPLWKLHLKENMVGVFKISEKQGLLSYGKAAMSMYMTDIR